MGELVIREATVADAAAIAEAHVRSWQEAYRGLLEQGYLDGLSVSERTETWRRRLSAKAGPQRTWVVCGPEVLGFATAGPPQDRNVGPEWGEVWAIYVHPSAWGRGAGAALFRHACDALSGDGYSSLCLWVLAGNERASRFYEAFGWVADGTSKAEELWPGVRATAQRYVAAPAGYFSHQ